MGFGVTLGCHCWVCLKDIYTIYMSNSYSTTGRVWTQTQRRRTVVNHPGIGVGALRTVEGRSEGSRAEAVLVGRGVLRCCVEVVVGQQGIFPMSPASVQGASSGLEARAWEGKG